jgi:hypothetical protein
MPLQIRRGTNAERLSITPAAGEPIYATDTHVLAVGDGVTPGGYVVGGYTLNTATATVLGGIKVGSNLSIAADGTLSATAQAFTGTAFNLTATNQLTVGNRAGVYVTLDTTGNAGTWATFSTNNAFSFDKTVNFTGGSGINGSIVLYNGITGGPNGYTPVVVWNPLSVVMNSQTLLAVTNTNATFTVPVVGTTATFNNVAIGLTTIVSSGSTSTLTASTSGNILITGSQVQYIQLPDATTLSNGALYFINNNSSYTGSIPVKNAGGTQIGSVAYGAAANIILTTNSTANGTWDFHGFVPSAVIFGQNSLQLGSSSYTIGANNSTLTVGNSSGNLVLNGSINQVKFSDATIQTTAYLGTATATTVGGVKVGSGINLAGDGTISVTPYTLTSATSTTLGGVKVGPGSTTGLYLTSDGSLRLQQPSYAISNSSALGSYSASVNSTSTNSLASTWTTSLIVTNETGGYATLTVVAPYTGQPNTSTVVYSSTGPVTIAASSGTNSAYAGFTFTANGGARSDSSGIYFPDSTFQQTAYLNAKTMYAKGKIVSGNPATTSTYGILPMNTSTAGTSLGFVNDPNYFIGATNYRFTPTVAGMYMINAIATFNPTFNTADTGTIGFAFYKNGSIANAVVDQVNVYQQKTLTLSGMPFMNGTTDYVDFRAISGAISQTQTINGTQNYTSFWINLVR